MTNIDNNIPVPEKKPRKTRTPRKSAAAKESPASGLIAALEFVSNAQQKEGAAYQTHCRIESNWLCAFNGVVAIGTPIIEDLKACPRTFSLLAALNKCKTKLAITQLNESVIRINSERFQVSIDCLPFEQVATSWPDPKIANISNSVKEALETIAWLATENSQHAFCAGVLLQANSAIATNRHVICEFWHGNDLPPELLIPKQSIVALSKIKKNINGFGYTPGNSATFWFEDGSYLKTQLFNDKFPQCAHILDKVKTANKINVPENFYEAVETVSTFSKDKFVHFKHDKLCSNDEVDLGANFELFGFPENVRFNSEYLLSVKEHFDNVHMLNESPQIFFSKGMLRGVIIGGV